MSLSSEAPATGGARSKFSGSKVILGPMSGGALAEMPLMQLEGKVKAPTWDEAMQSEYLERVRARAATKAKEILDQASAEAAQLKARAYEEGLAEGRAEAGQELEAAMNELGGHMAGLLALIDAHAPAVMERHRQDLAALVRAAVEKVIDVELSERRTEILEALLDRAVDAMEIQRRLIIRVAPGDEERMAELLKLAKERHPGLERWRVKGDPAVAEGGLVVESELGLVDSRIKTRLERVRDVLDQISLEEA